MKKLFVNNKLVATGDYSIAEIDEEPKYTVKIVYDSGYEMDQNTCVKFYSNHKDFSFDGDVTDEIISGLKSKNQYKNGKKYFPVYMMDHSGYSLSKTPFGGIYGYFDSGMLGIAEIDIANAKKVTGSKNPNLSSSLFDEFFTELKAVMEGSVFGYQVLDETENIVDSCYGFYGKTNDIIDCMLSYISSEYNITKEDLEKAFDNVEY